MPEPVVWVADIGSVVRQRFGWCRLTADGNSRAGREIDDFARGIAQDLNEGNLVALGFECPLFVPVPGDPTGLTKARRGEGNRPWSAGAGAGALATGLTECVWVLERVRSLTRVSITATLAWERLKGGEANLFIWEAFVTGGVKGDSHQEDAQIAAETFWTRYPNIAEANAVEAENCYSLVGAALLRAGLVQDLSVLRQPCIVVRSLACLGQRPRHLGASPLVRRQGFLEGR